MERDNSYLKGNKFAVGSKPNKTAFKKGHKPWNKNKKGIHLSVETEFKKGCMSNTILSVGTITRRQRKSRKEHPRNWIKISDPSEWQMLACYVWEQHHGPIPKGYIIHHKDRDSLNDEIKNLEIMTRSQHIKEHRNDLRKIRK